MDFKTMLRGERAAAKFLNIDPVTLWRLKKSGQIPFYKIRGRCYYDPAQIMQSLFHPARNQEGGQK